MKLTAFGKFFLALVILGVLGFVVFQKYGAQIKDWAGAGQGAKPRRSPRTTSPSSPPRSCPTRHATGRFR